MVIGKKKVSHLTKKKKKKKKISLQTYFSSIEEKLSLL